MKKNFDVTGMTCSACSNRVEKVVSHVPGVEDVNVNLLKNSMTVDYDETKTGCRYFQLGCDYHHRLPAAGQYCIL